MAELTEEASSQIYQLNSLIGRAQNLISKSHPGKTTEFIGWKSELETFLTRNCGNTSQEWLKFCSLMFFPKWYNPKEHGPIPSNVPGVVITDSQEHDRETALSMFNDALTESIGIMKGLVIHINRSGWGLHLKEDSTKNSGSPVFQTTFSQVQGQVQAQKQEQEQNITVEQSIQLTLEKVKESYGEEDAKKAEELLNELKKDKKWTTIQKVSSWFLGLGREAFIALLPTLVKILIGV